MWLCGSLLSDFLEQVHRVAHFGGSDSTPPSFPQEEMNGWLEAVANSVAEHAEIARWSQTLPTTSSTDEGNPKREGGERERRASGRRK